jgi:hypothetical protein
MDRKNDVSVNMDALHHGGLRSTWGGGGAEKWKGGIFVKK